MLRMFQRTLGAVVLPLLFGAAAHAADLTIGLSTPVTSLDPHFHNLTPNNSLGRHVFETLVRQDETQTMQPGLAESWKALNELEWEIKLRKGVKFHNGQNFTADDVIATFKRVPNVPNSPASFAFFVRPIVDIKAVDPLTLRLKTDKPHPLLPNDMVAVMILPKSVAETAKTEDFNSGKAMIGTGPYRLVEYAAGDRVVLKRNDAYWGQKPAWENVRFKMIPSAPARVAALLAGDVQMIEGVPTADIANLKTDKRVTISSAVSNRVVYLHMDSGREKSSPFVTTADGKPMEANPLRDPRVRRAISKMIDRDAIVSRIMEGQGVAAGQLLPDQFFGTSKSLKPDKYDPEGAKKLLAEAGYPDGIDIEVHTADLEPGMVQFAEVYQQQVAKAGIRVKLTLAPSDGYWDDVWMKVPVAMTSWSARPADQILNEAYRTGSSWNESYYSNPAYDQILDKARASLDINEARKLYQEAQRILFEEGATFIPYQQNGLRVLTADVSGIKPLDEDFIRWHLVDMAGE